MEKNVADDSKITTLPSVAENVSEEAGLGREEEDKARRRSGPFQKNLSSIRKCGRVTSSGLMKTEMDLPGFSVTSC